MSSFDPNAAATDGSGIFGLPYTDDESSLIYLPVPWEATTSYGKGTSTGPSAIFDASKQVDLFDLEINRPYEAGLYYKDVATHVLEWNQKACIGSASLAEINHLSQNVNQWVFDETQKILAQNKTAALIGGDHSVPLGAFKAIAQKRGSFGILHFDAHSDTRIAYEGYTYSHASIMYNALEEVPQIERLVQVGIRDFCQQEFEYCQSQGTRVRTFYDSDLIQKKFYGQAWDEITHEMVIALPQKVWISFDIDGLDPRFCPHTGTPVPGGLDFNEAIHIIRKVVASGREIIGFDLNEVAPGPDGDEWDANVAARLLYKLSAWTLLSQRKVTRRS
jgi:agmatinase